MLSVRPLLLFSLLLTACPVVAAESLDALRVAPLVESSSDDSSAHTATNAERAKVASLCSRDEKIIWSCETTGRKTVSICSSRELDKERGYLQYRFGRPGNVELEYPVERHNTQTAFTYFRYTRPLVTYLGLRFRVKEYEYEVYDNSNEEADGGAEAGVTVTPAGNSAKTVDYRCRKPVTHHLIELEEVVPNTTMTPGGP